jgi:hypothetical protein
MQNYLQLILFGLLIGLLSLYIGSIAIKDSFDVPILKTFQSQDKHNEDARTPAQKLMQRQKMLIQYRQEQFRSTMHNQKQRIRDNMRTLKEKLRNNRY